MTDSNLAHSASRVELGNDQRKEPPFFFSSRDYENLCAFAARIIPSGSNVEEDPGASEVGTVNYVDSWILHESDSTKADFRQALEFIDRKCMERFGLTFKDLLAEKQDDFLTWMAIDPKGSDFFDKLRGACIEGFYSDYCDPDYVGRTAWSLVGFQGKRISDLKKDWSFLRIYREKDCRP